jgi:hypothetical protein
MNETGEWRTTGVWKPRKLGGQYYVEFSWRNYRGEESTDDELSLEYITFKDRMKSEQKYDEGITLKEHTMDGFDWRK